MREVSSSGWTSEDHLHNECGQRRAVTGGRSTFFFYKECAGTTLRVFLSRFRYSFICQGTSTSRQRSGLRVKLRPFRSSSQVESTTHYKT